MQALLPQYSEPSFCLDSITYTKLIQSSTRTGSLILGQLAHAHIIKTSFRPCLFLLNNLLNMYCKCGEWGYAHQLFDQMTKRNVITYNSLITCYNQMGFYNKALNVFKEGMVVGLRLDKFTYAGALSVSGQSGNLQLGMQIHSLIIVSGLGGEGVFLTNSLIDMYCKCGQVDRARFLFENSDDLDAISWNSMIAGYVRIRGNEEMWRLLVKMHRSGLNLNNYTLGSVLKACCRNSTNSIEYGKILHGYTVRLGLDLDVVVGTALLDMYTKTGNLDCAVQIFEVTPKNVVTYNAMIAGFLQTDIVSDECANEAFFLFSEMQRQGLKPSKFTFSSVLKACNAVEALEYGEQIHAQICKNNLQSNEFIGSALIELYSFFGSVEDGLRCFHSTPKIDVVSWTSMIAGLVQNGQFEIALSMFFELLASGRKPDEFTISITLSACANSALGRSGEQIQGYGIKTGIGDLTIIKNSQICMYAKSGDIDSANLTFEETKNPDVVSWSVMICSYAQHGCAREALSLFELMKDRGIAPNHITFLGVLTACSHGGLIEEGLRYFESMKKDYAMTTSVKHCACIADLLGRAGKLVDAETFILDSGFVDDPVMWRALLSACRLHKDTVTGKRVAEKVIELEPQVAASYVLLYNIYNDAGIQLPATRIRDLMKERGVKKEPGLSWIEVGNKVHSFVVGDRSHPMSQMIYAKLEEMLEEIKKIGYVDERLDSSALDPELKGTSALLNYHSEKLAVTFGIISLPTSAPVRVMKNLRVCRDCHTTINLFSKVKKREIVLRDPIRFHRFREGSCSCGDYW